MSNLCQVQLASSTFWRKIEELKSELESLQSVNNVLNEMKGAERSQGKIFSTKNISREEVMIRIENTIQTFLEELSSGTFPKFTLNKRGGENNTTFTEGQGMEMIDKITQTTVSLENPSSVNKFAVMMSTLSMCYKLLQNNTHASKRDIYYTDVNFFQNQHSVDEAITDIACMLGVSRHSLNVIASSKGLLAGDLIFKDEDGTYIDCNKNGVQIPTQIEGIRNFVSKAKYVLVIEKEATYRRLVEERITEKYGPSILVTGKGFPDVNTRMFIHKLWSELQIPIFALVDADPHGIEIMCIYRFGSKAMAFEAQNLTCSSMRWIGVLPSDVDEMNISDSVLIPLSEGDKKKARDLLKRPYIERRPELKEQLETLLERGKKAEIECLDSVSQTFMSSIYLPHKFRDGGWI